MSDDKEKDAHRRFLGKWAQSGVPHKGWWCSDWEDMGPGNVITCEMCESAIVRYVHHMRHPDYPKMLDVGVYCAGAMSGDYKGARQREARMKSRASRQQTFVASKRWRPTRNGHERIKYKDRTYVVGRNRSGLYWAGVGNGNGLDFFPRKYPTVDGAKAAAFEFAERSA